MIDLHGRAVRRRIDRWREAGLIDAATAESLDAFEAVNRPSFGGALTVLGAVSVGLGLAALVAANWEAIPVTAKLSAHAAINFALGIWAYLLIDRGRGGSPACEGLVVVLSVSTLALIAHIGQSFQLQGDEFGLSAAWLALTTPFTLALARGAAVRWLWTVGLFVTVGLAFAKYFDLLEAAGLIGAGAALFVVIGYAAPLVVRGNLVAWGVHLNHVMLGVTVPATAAAQIGWRLDLSREEAGLLRPELLTGTAVAVVGLLAVGLMLARGRADRLWLTVFVAASPVYAALPWLTGGADSAGAAAAAFCLYGLAVAFLAHSGGAIRLYKIAVTVVVLRLFVFFAEASDGLWATAGGLMLSGALLLAMGYGLRRILRDGGKS